MIELKTKTTTVIECSDWDAFVEACTGKKYCFQQQSDCRSRGTEYLTVPSEWADDFENDEIEIAVNGEEMGVSLKAWLARDPEDKFFADDFHERLFWERNFYPDLETLANYLHEKGFLSSGKYTINIDW